MTGQEAVVRGLHDLGDLRRLVLPVAVMMAASSVADATSLRFVLRIWNQSYRPIRMRIPAEAAHDSGMKSPAIPR